MSPFDEWFSLTGKVAVVTGAGTGLGRAMALGLAKAGADVVCWGRHKQTLDGTAHVVAGLGRQTAAMITDVESTSQIHESVTRTVQTFGRIDILINNAGILHSAPSRDLAEEDWNRVVRTNLTGAFLCAQAVGNHMTEAGGGKIINVGSIFGLLGTTHALAYSCSKAAIHEMTRCLAVEWARHRITVNAIVPGHFETDLNSKTLSDPELSATIQKKLPIRRFGRPEDLEPLVVYLASASADYVTGQMFCIDGGYSIALYF